MRSFRIYGEGPILAYPSSTDAAFVDATVKALLDGDRTTAVVVDRSRVLYLFLGRDPTDEGGSWQRYVSEYVADEDDTPADALAVLGRELAKLRLDDGGWEYHPHDEAWLDALGRATDVSGSDDVALLTRLAGGDEPTLSFGMATADRAVGVATALSRTGVSAAIVDGDGTPPATADVILRPGHDADFVPLDDRSEELWEWKRDDTEMAARSDTNEPVATDGGGLEAILERTTNGRRRPSLTVPNRLTAAALGLTLVVVAGLAVATIAVVGAGPSATGAGGSLDDGGNAGPTTATGTATATDSDVTPSASVTGTTVETEGRVTAGGAGDAAFGLDTPEDDATIRSGTLRVSGRSPTDSVVVRVTDATGTRVLQTNASVSGGEFQTWITGLPDGRYTLTVTAAGDRGATRTVAVD